MAEKIGKQAHGQMPPMVASIADDLLLEQRLHRSMQREASRVIPEMIDYATTDRVAFSQAGELLRTAVHHGGLGVYEAANGHIWRVVVGDDGETYLERDAALTEETLAVQELMNEGR